MIKKLKIFLPCLVMLFVAAAFTAPVGTLAVDETVVTSRAGLEAALADSSVTAIKLGGSVSGTADDPLTLNISRSLTLDGGGYKLTYASIKAGAESITVKNLTVSKPFSGVAAVIEARGTNFFNLDAVTVEAGLTGGAGEGTAVNGVLLAGARNTTLTNLSVSGAAAAGVSAVKEGTFATDAQIFGIKAVANGAGTFAVSGGSTLFLSAADNLHDELVTDGDGAPLIKDPELAFDPNVGDGNVLVLVAKYEQGDGNVGFASGFKYIRKSVTYGGKTYNYIILPYDQSPPFMSLNKIPVAYAANSTVDLSVMTVTDNRDTGNQIKVYFEVTAPDGSPVTLSNSPALATADYVNGYKFTAAQDGDYQITCRAADRYGNATLTRYITVYVGSLDRTAPVISGSALSRVYTAGGTAVVPSFTATDETDGARDVTVKLIKPDGSQETLSSGASITFSATGVYNLVVTASDTSGNDARYIQEINVTAQSVPVIDKFDPPKDGINPAYFIAGAIVVVGAAAAGFLIFRRRPDKK